MVVYRLHRVIFDQHKPLICREIVHKVKETVKGMSTAKRERCSIISLRSVTSRNKGLCRRHHIASGSAFPSS
jgi:hypothetical protein